MGLPLKRIQVETAPDGELLLRGPNIMKGYYKLEAETKEAIDENGWLHTGDIAKIDVEGYIAITDRKKEIIVLSGGKNVSPAYVEGKLTGDKFISQACVIGDRRKHLAALVVPDYENLVDFLKENNLDPKNADALAKSKELKDVRPRADSRNQQATLRRRSDRDVHDRPAAHPGKRRADPVAKSAPQDSAGALQGSDRFNVRRLIIRGAPRPAPPAGVTPAPSK